jgi:hypothetical protein
VEIAMCYPIDSNTCIEVATHRTDTCLSTTARQVFKNNRESGIILFMLLEFLNVRTTFIASDRCFTLVYFIAAGKDNEIL